MLSRISSLMRSVFLASFIALPATLTLLACGGGEDSFPVDDSAVAYYHETYAENRAAFRAVAAELTASGGRTGSIALPSQANEDLTVDWAFLPAAGGPAQRLLIVSSGVHGGEGYTASAVQRMFMREFLAARPAAIDVLLVHGINPWGMRHFRRVTENNVDLNRNFDTDPALFAVKNEGYGELDDFLNPREPASVGFFGDLFFPAQAVYFIATKGMPALRQAILQGQYEYPQGLYFGGKDFEAQRGLIEPLLRQYIAGKRLVLTIDLHTGYGERGRLHLFPNPIEDPMEKKLAEDLFAGYQIDWGDTDDFYTNYGDFSTYIGDLVPEQDLYVPMLFEYGTMDSQTTMGSIRSIQNMILENQGYHHGYAADDDRAEIERRMREAYFPSSPGWRSKIVADSRAIFPLVLERLAAAPANSR